MTSTLAARLSILSLLAVAGLSSSLAPKASAQETSDPVLALKRQLDRVLELKRQVGRLVVDGVKRQAAGELDASQALYQQALELAEKNLEPDDSFIALSLDYLGANYFEMGELTRAEALLQRAVRIFEKAPDLSDPSYAKALEDFALVCHSLGDYSRAQPLSEKALAIRETLFGPDHSQVAQSLNVLGTVYLSKADHSRAAQMFERALAINQKLFSPEHPRVTIVLGNLAKVYEGQGELIKAEQLLQQAVASAERSTKPDNINLANLLNQLGMLYSTQNTLKARPLLDRALAIKEKILGPHHPEVGNLLNDLAMIDWQDGDLKRAEQRLLRGSSILQQAFGRSHPDVSSLAANLALLYAFKGDMKRAISLLVEGSDDSERHLLMALASGSEEQKRIYMASVSDGTSATISLHVRLAPDDTQAARVALTLILRRKGRLLDVMSGQVASLMGRLDMDNRGVLTKLAGVRAQLSNLMRRGSDDDSLYKTRVAGLQRQMESLERQISERATTAGVNFGSVTIDATQKAIPANAALVEIVQYRPFTFSKTGVPQWEVPRYVAYVLKHTGSPSWVELGVASKIDRNAAQLLAGLKNPQSSNLRSLARAVDEDVMRPIRKLLGNAQQVFISPDGKLNLLPWAALIDEQDRYLVENFTFTYLTSGRDLMNLGKHLPSKQDPVVIANPLFEGTDKGDLRADKNTGSSKNVRSANFGQRFQPLEGTAGEAQQVSAVLSRSSLFTGAQATESVVKQLKAPSILHIATHGFFLLKPAAPSPRPGTVLSSGPISDPGILMAENPLLRSGIALTGANKLDDGQGEDGILTAFEAAGLDLHGTKLVVLSACETGVGEIEAGDGVYGLRRALIIAGAESQVISLWKVDDEATSDLMIGFYKALQSGQGRSDALRQVQLKLLKGRDYSHPFFWAGFILSGDWRPL